MWKCKKVYLTRGRLGEQLSDLEMSQQVGSIAEKRSRRNGPQRQNSPDKSRVRDGRVDWLMPLPDDLRIQFRNQLQQRLPDTAMPHITLFEELALKEGLEKGIKKGLLEGRQEGRQEGLVQNAREAILDVLDTRFGQVPDSVREQVNALCSEPTLKDLLRRAARASSLDEFLVAL